MPDLRGQDASSALARLEQMGVTPFVIEIPSRDAPAGQVIRQSPNPNEDVRNATVTIVVSQGG
jgi:beta-lactam-binding protein with PASTA domain